MTTHQHRQAAMKRRWERKHHQQQALRFIEEDDDDEEASSYYRASSSSNATTTSTALRQLSTSNNDENEDALEVLANTVNVTKDGNYVTKEEFDFAMQAAQNALKAKTHANHMLTLQAKAAMQNAVMALKITEKEVRARLRAFFVIGVFFLLLPFFLSLSLSSFPGFIISVINLLLLLIVRALAVSNVANATGGFEKRSRFSDGVDD